MSLLELMSPQEVARVGDELTIQKAFELLLKVVPARYKFKRETLRSRMRLIDGGAGFAVFAQAEDVGHILVSLEKNDAWLLKEYWTPKLRRQYMAVYEPPADAEHRAEQSKTVRGLQWVQRKWHLLEQHYLAHTRRHADGAWTVCLLRKPVEDLMRADMVVFEERQFRKCCGPEVNTWAEAVEDCVRFEMEERQRDAFRKHARFGDGLALAEDVLASSNKAEVALSTVRLKDWAEALERDAFAHGVSARALALELAAEMLALPTPTGVPCAPASDARPNQHTAEGGHTDHEHRSTP